MDKKPAPPPGLYEDVTYEEYDSWEAVRPTVIKGLQKDACMELCKHRIDNPKPPGPALVVGNATHTLAMEPELFEKRYSYVPPTYMKDGDKKGDSKVKTKWNWNAKVCKAWGTEQEAAGKTVIRKAAQQFPRPKEAVEGMAGAITGHSLANRLLSGGLCEVSVVWVDESSGVLCKARIDYVRPGKGGGDIIVDIKTAMDVSPDAICRSFYNFGYHIQAAMGWDGLKAVGKDPERYLYVAVRNKKPYMVNVVEAEEPVLNMGRSQYKWYVKEWGKCLETGVYPGYNATGVTSLMMPGWAGQEL